MDDAVAYTRISDDRDGLALGVGRQREDTTAKGKSLGWNVAEFYEDNDITADPKKRQRPEFQRLLADMRSGKVKRVLCYDQDRLVRDMRELEDVVDAVEAGDVELTSVNGDIDLRTDNGRMVARIKGAVARNELEKISRRVLRQQRQHAEAGKKHQGQFRTYGFTRDMEPMPAEAAVVQEVFKRKAKGESLTTIATDLNDRGFTTTGGGRWDASAVSKMVKRRDYIAEVTIKGEVVGKASWEAVVDRALWEAANAEAEKINNRGRGARKSLLSGFLVCGTCLTKMKQGGGQKEPRYNCPSPKQTPGACGSCSVTVTKTDDAVFNAVWRKEQEGEPPQPDGPKRDYKAEQDALNAEMEQVHQFRSAGQLALPDAVRMLRDLQTRLGKVIRDEAADTVVDLGHMRLMFDWEGWNLSQQRLWLDQYISYVVVDKHNPALPKKGYRPERLEVHYVDGTSERLRRGNLLDRIGGEPKPKPECLEGDGKPVYAKRLCHNHYKAAWRRDQAASRLSAARD